MKTYRGYPAEVHIDGKETTVHDVERLILSLYWDKEIPENDNDRLSTDYKQERQRWLDSQFVHDDEHAKLLEEVAEMLKAAYKRMQDTAETFVAEQQTCGEERAKGMVIHMEIDDLNGGQSEGVTDEDADLWDALCNEDRYHDPHWGVYCITVDLSDPKAKAKDLLWWKEAHNHDKADKAVKYQFTTLRERYQLAWQDVIRIPRFKITVDVEY